MTEWCLSENYKIARVFEDELINFTKVLFVETNPVPVKYLLHRLNLYESDLVRAPLSVLEDESIKKIIQDGFNKIIYPSVPLSSITDAENMDNNIDVTEKERIDEEAMESFYFT